MYGYGTCGWNPCYPAYGYAAPIYGGCGFFGGRSCFTLIVVLFILLIIIGASFCGPC